MGRHDRGGDIEAGFGDKELYPGMMETPELRWGFIRKVYIILTLQMITTVAVASVVISVRSISYFMLNTWEGLAIYITLVISTILIMIPLHYYQSKHPLNLILLFMFTVVMALLVGLACATKNGNVILEAAILTSVVVVGLTLYTFWAVKRGHDFSFLGPFLFCALLLLLIFGLIQIFFPLGKLAHTIWCLVGALIFCGFIIYDTDNLIKNFSYDEYISGAICLYMDIINLFLMLLQLLDDT